MVRGWHRHRRSTRFSTAGPRKRRRSTAPACANLPGNYVGKVWNSVSDGGGQRYGAVWASVLLVAPNFLEPRGWFKHVVLCGRTAPLREHAAVLDPRWSRRGRQGLSRRSWTSSRRSLACYWALQFCQLLKHVAVPAIGRAAQARFRCMILRNLKIVFQLTGEASATPSCHSFT